MQIFSILDLAELYNFDVNNLYNLLDETKETHELSEIMSKYNSDKGYGLCQEFITNNKYPPNCVCHNYTYFYSQLFSEYRNENLTIFEMGVGVPLCMGLGSWAGSLLGWKEYFPNSTIFSADFDKDYLYCDERIKSYYVNQECVDSINNDLWKNLEEHTFDIMIDDGPHTHLSNILFYKNSIHKLKTNGVYIIEDINLDFIDQLHDEILEYNKDNSINCNIIKLIIPWPEKFTHSHSTILKMNNLIILQKI
jgi:hypothetical protein